MRGFTLFTPLVGSILLLIAVAFAVYMIMGESQKVETVGGAIEYQKMEQIAQLIRTDAMQAFNLGFRRGMKNYMDYVRIVLDEDDLRGDCREKWREIIEKSFVGGDEFQSKKGGRADLAAEMAVEIGSALARYNKVTYQNYYITLDYKKEDFQEVLESLMRKSKLSVDPQTGSVYVDVDLRDLSEEEFKKLPKIIIEERTQAGRTVARVKVAVLPRGSFRLLVPLRLEKMGEAVCTVYDTVERHKDEIFSFRYGACTDKATCGLYSSSGRVFPPGDDKEMVMGDEEPFHVPHLPGPGTPGPCSGLYFLGKVTENGLVDCQEGEPGCRKFTCNYPDPDEFALLINAYINKYLPAMDYGDFKAVATVSLDSRDIETKATKAICRADCFTLEDVGLFGILGLIDLILNGVLHLNTFVPRLNKHFICPTCQGEMEPDASCIYLKRLPVRITGIDLNPEYAAGDQNYTFDVLIYFSQPGRSFNLPEKEDCEVKGYDINVVVGSEGPLSSICNVPIIGKLCCRVEVKGATLPPMSREWATACAGADLNSLCRTYKQRKEAEERCVDACARELGDEEECRKQCRSASSGLTCKVNDSGDCEWCSFTIKYRACYPSKGRMVSRVVWTGDSACDQRY